MPPWDIGGCKDRNKTVGKLYTLLFARFLPIQRCFVDAMGFATVKA